MGPKPPFWNQVYGWKDTTSFEEDGRIVACGGLWDKGGTCTRSGATRRPAEREDKSIRRALMDFGYAAGREDAMVRLIEFFAGMTKTLGRDHLAAGIEHLPRLVKATALSSPAPEPARSTGSA